MIDTHAHIDMLNNIDEVIARAKANGVKAIIAPASSLGSNNKIISLSEKYKNYVFPCLGLSYIDDKRMEQAAEIVEKNKDRIVAIGEVGLDYYWKQNIERKKNQKINFDFFIDLAQKLKKPLVVHARNAMTDTFDMLKQHNAKKVIMHCFAGTKEEMFEAVDRGYWISFSTMACYSKQLQSLINECSLSNMLVETDSPYLHPDRKKPNEPANVRRAIELISSIKKVGFDEVNNITEKNSIEAFNLKLV